MADTQDPRNTGINWLLGGVYGDDGNWEKFDNNNSMLNNAAQNEPVNDNLLSSRQGINNTALDANQYSDEQRNAIEDTGQLPFDSQNFDVTDKDQVLNLQKRLFPDDPSQWDSMFGPKTEEAYRGMVNTQRTDSGQDPYVYNDDSMSSLAMDNQAPQELSQGAAYQPYAPKNPFTGEPMGWGGSQGQQTYQANQAKRDEIAANQEASLQAQHGRKLNRARDRHSEGKRVWNRKMRDIVNEEDATQTSQY